MQKKSLIRVTFSLILALALFITTVIISPRVASAQNTPKTPLEALEQGIQFDEQGDLVNAESSYKEAIRMIVENSESDVDILIKSKLSLAEIIEDQNQQQEANRLREEAKAGEKALALSPKEGFVSCGDCGELSERKRANSTTMRCGSCSGG